MFENALDTQLGLLEAQLAQLAVGLLDEDPDNVRQGSHNLQQLAGACVQLASSIQRPVPAMMHQRIQRLSRDLSVLREQLARRQAFVDQSLNLLIPAAKTGTYGSKGPYASAGRASGSLRTLSA